MGAVPRAVPSAVAPSTGGNNVDILTSPQAGPYQPMSGNAVIGQVPATPVEGQVKPQPHWTSPPGTHVFPGDRVNGAPSLPGGGSLAAGIAYVQGPLSEHYNDLTEVPPTYTKVNNPPTRGMFTWVKRYLNHAAFGPQVVDANGFRISPPQQRESVMRITPPPHGAGYAPETFVPRQLPQRTPIAKFMPALGTVPYGQTQVNGGTGSRKGPLNRNTFGAGQTAGGQGGSQYTPAPGPPVTVSTAGNAADTSGMPTWG